MMYLLLKIGSSRMGYHQATLQPHLSFRARRGICF